MLRILNKLINRQMTSKDIGKKITFFIVTLLLTTLTCGLYPVIQIMYYVKEIAENTSKD